MAWKKLKLTTNIFYPHTAHWHNRDVYPLRFTDETRQVLASFHDQYAWPKSNPDHQVYRIERNKYKKKDISQGIRSMSRKQYLTVKKTTKALTTKKSELASLLETGGMKYKSPIKFNQNKIMD